MLVPHVLDRKSREECACQRVDQCGPKEIKKTLDKQNNVEREARSSMIQDTHTCECMSPCINGWRRSLVQVKSVMQTGNL